MKKEKKEELKIEDFIEYLPYGLEMYDSSDKRWLLTGSDINDLDTVSVRDIESCAKLVTRTCKPLLNPFTPESIMEIAEFVYGCEFELIDSVFSNVRVYVLLKTKGIVEEEIRLGYRYNDACFIIDDNLSYRNKEISIKARKMHLDLNGLLFKGLAANKKEVDKPKLKYTDLHNARLVEQLAMSLGFSVGSEIYDSSLNTLNYAIALLSEPGVNDSDAKSLMLREIEKIKELKADIVNSK